MTLPNFNRLGLLPAGEHELDLPQLKASILVQGKPGLHVPGKWDHQWRLHLVNNLEILVEQLNQVGITDVLIGGSFVENKYHPNDIDGCFSCEREFLVSGELERQLNQLDPFNCWTWDPSSRMPYRGYGKRQLPMWHYYRVELFPDYGQKSGICDSKGIELTFPEAFRLSREDFPKGVVRLRGSA
jgi:hypothetical protein|nr:hypothetical protein [Candidatus Krumholzibacteria bacterium]